MDCADATDEKSEIRRCEIHDSNGDMLRTIASLSPFGSRRRDRDPEAITVGQTMSTDLLYCFESESAEDVSRKMGDWWVRRLPVNQNKRLIGMVSLADLTPP